MQLMIYKGWLDCPELQKDGKTSTALIVSFVLTLFSLLTKLNQVASQSKALKEE